MIPFNEIYTIAHENDSKIRQGLDLSPARDIQQRPTIFGLLRRLLGSSQEPVGAPATAPNR